MEQAEPYPSTTLTVPAPAASPADPRRPSIAPKLEDKLTIYRLAIGINTHHSMMSPTMKVFTGRRPAPNLGIYVRVVHNEQAAKRAYKIAYTSINSCLVLQIIIAAALTAMGAANTSHGAITTFGAINTVIAGFLTFLKGSGLPNRLKYYQGEWKRVRELIEQRERAFMRPGCDLDLREVVEEIEKKYEEVKTDVAANTPDAYVSIGQMGRRAHGHGPTPAFPADVSVNSKAFDESDKAMHSGVTEHISKMSGHGAEKVAHFSDMASEKAAGLSGIVSEKAGKFPGLKEKAERLSGLTEKAEELASEISHHAKDEVQHATRLGEDAERNVKDAEKGIDVHIGQHKEE